MSLFYRVAYRLGFTPWEHAATHPPAARHIREILDREERGRARPLGRALDLGCGRGLWAVELARRGWEVTGVDLVPRAVRAARERARAAGVDAAFVEGDITALPEAELGSGFRLFWDFGTIHGLTPGQRASAGRAITRLASADAVAWILAWTPGRRGPLPSGVSREDLLAAFPGWEITAEEPFDASGLPRPLRAVAPRFYRLGRVAAAEARSSAP